MESERKSSRPVLTDAEKLVRARRGRKIGVALAAIIYLGVAAFQWHAHYADSENRPHAQTD